MKNKIQKAVDAYRKHRHLKKASDETGIPWQTIYVYLKQAGEPVTGDKSFYGSPKDKLACLGEAIFSDLVPHATDKNLESYQPKVDFIVDGWLVDVKTAAPNRSGKYPSKRWAFCLKKQIHFADFFVLVALTEEKNLEKLFLVPAELLEHKQTISIPVSLNSKWAAYSVEEDQLKEFFSELPNKEKAA